MPEESRKYMSWTELRSFDEEERLRSRGKWLPYISFPGSTYLSSFRNGVLMMTSDLRDSYLAECLYTAGVVLEYAGGIADRAASLPSLPSDQFSIAYAGRPGDRAAVFVLLLYSALCR